MNYCLSSGVLVGIVLFGSVVAVAVPSGFVALSSVSPVPAVIVVLIVVMAPVPMRTSSCRS